MANPQVDAGKYMRIANELMDALAMTRIPGEARQIIDFIFRKTYGWQKKEDRIPLSQFCLATKMPKPTVIRAISKARDMNIIIIKKDNDGNSIYLINKDFSTWRPLTKKITLSKMITIVDNNDNESLSKMIPSKETTKDNSKDNDVAAAKKIKKPKLPDGETWRGKSQDFDIFLNICKERKIFPGLKPSSYFGLRDEYTSKVNWTKEVKGCIAWLKDNDKKFVSANRLRNRMEIAIDIQKRNERFRLENEQEKRRGNVSVGSNNSKVGSPTVHSANQKELEICTVCHAVATRNVSKVCNSCSNPVENLCKT